MMEHEIKQIIERISDDTLNIFFDVSADSLTFKELLKSEKKVNKYRDVLWNLQEKHKSNLDLEKINQIENLICSINTLKNIIVRKIEHG